MTFSTTIENVTPEKAAEWLMLNYFKQRPISEARVTTLGNEMRIGRFNSYHPPIAFCVNGKLFDGQHRLSAIIASKCTQLMPVTRGIPEDQYAYFDIGKIRTMSDRIGRPKRQTEVATAILRCALGIKLPDQALVNAAYESFEPWIDLLSAHASSAGATAPVKAALAILCDMHPQLAESINKQFASFVNDDLQGMSKNVARFYTKVKVDKSIPTTNREEMFNVALVAFDPTAKVLKKLMRSDERAANVKRYAERLLTDWQR